MKLSIIILIVLGLLAALSTAILVGTLRAGTSDSSAEDSSSVVEVVLATTALPAMTVITSENVTTNTVPKKDLPEGYLSSPVQVIGRVLVTSVVEEQILTKACLVADGSAAQLAAAIPHGKRAISIMLSNNAIIGGLLYPGSIVDVLASFRLPSRDRHRGQAISTTLLQGIQVLAVDDVSVVSQKDNTKSSSSKRDYTGNRKVMLTLMVNSKQAEALQLAREYGKISVALRNPLDKLPVNSDTTVLSESQLAKFGSIMTPAVLTDRQKQSMLKEMESSTSNNKDGEGAKANSELPKKKTKLTAPSNQWGVTVIRGSNVKIQQLDLSRQNATY